MTRFERNAPKFVTDGINKRVSPLRVATSILPSWETLSMIEAKPETGWLALTTSAPVVPSPPKSRLTLAI